MSLTVKSELEELNRILDDVDQLVNQTAVHRKKFEFFVNQFHKLLNSLSKIPADEAINPKHAEEIRSLYNYIYEFQQIIFQYQLHNWAHITLENSSMSVARELTELASKIRSTGIALNSNLTDSFKSDNNEWLQYHFLDLKGIVASFSQYLDNPNPNQKIVKLMKERLRSMDAFMKQFENETLSNGVQVFSPIPLNYQEWKINYDDLKVLKEVGQGVSANVFYGIDKRNKKKVAIKQLKFKKLSGSKLQAFQREITVLATVNHPCLLGFNGATDTAPYCIVTDWMPNSTLYHEIHKFKRLNPTLRTIALFDIARGMKYLHSKNIIHRDLKSLNVLFDENFHAKICDFGFSKYTDKEDVMTLNVGTTHWMAPELLSGDKKYTSKIDVYAYGIVLWEVVSNDIPFKGLEPPQIITQVLINNKRPIIPPDTNPALKNLITQCWDRDPNKRPSFEEIEARFVSEKIMLNGCNERTFIQYIKDTIGLHPMVSLQFEKKFQNDISLQDVIDAVEKQGIPNNLVYKCWSVVENNKNINPFVIGKIAFGFLSTPVKLKAGDLIRGLPCGSIPKNQIAKELEKLPTGCEELDLDLIITACKNGIPDLAVVYAFYPKHIKIALEIVSQNGADITLKAAVADRCIQCLNSKDSSLICAAIRCLIGIGEIRRITTNILSNLLKNPEKSIINCSIILATSISLLNDGRISLEMVKYVLENYQNNEYIEQFIISSCCNPQIANYIINNINIKYIFCEETVLRVFLISAQNRSLRPLISNKLQNFKFKDIEKKYCNEISQLKLFLVS